MRSDTSESIKIFSSDETALIDFKLTHPDTFLSILQKIESFVKPQLCYNLLAHIKQ